DVVTDGQPLRDETAKMLRSAEHLGAVSLNDESDLHYQSGGRCAPDAPRGDPEAPLRSDCTSDVSSRLMPSSLKSASRRRWPAKTRARRSSSRSEEHTSELQSRGHLVCRLLLEKKKKKIQKNAEYCI